MLEMLFYKRAAAIILEGYSIQDIPSKELESIVAVNKNINSMNIDDITTSELIEVSRLVNKYGFLEAIARIDNFIVDLRKISADEKLDAKISFDIWLMIMATKKLLENTMKAATPFIIRVLSSTYLDYENGHFDEKKLLNRLETVEKRDRELLPLTDNEEFTQYSLFKSSEQKIDILGNFYGNRSESINGLNKIVSLLGSKRKITSFLEKIIGILSQLDDDIYRTAIKVILQIEPEIEEKKIECKKTNENQLVISKVPPK